MTATHLSSPAQVAALRDSLAAQGKRLVFTNGVFDILHAGHVRYLNEARALGDAMVIAMNSDASVRALKGPTRPVNGQEDRAEVLLGLRAVDAVVVYDDERCTSLIQTIQPQVYAKGGDYTVETLNPEERAALQAAGSDIHILPLVPGRSTTATLQRLQSGPASTPRRFRLAVLGSGHGSNFDAILDAIASGTLDAEVALVLSDNRDARILTRAREHGITAVHVDPGPDPARLAAPAQKEITDRLRAAGVDLVVLAGFLRRLKEPVLSTFAGKIINVHPSLLPAFPGLKAWEQALAAGATETGCTVHYVDAGLDTGPPIAQATVPILPGDTPDDVRLRINAAERDLYPRTIARLAAAGREG